MAFDANTGSDLSILETNQDSPIERLEPRQNPLDAAIEQLDSPYRSTLRLFNECEDAPQVAATLGVAQSTVRWRLMVARNQLRQLVPRSPQPAERAAS